MDDQDAELRQFIQPVGDVDAATRFYAAAFRFAAKFTDGDRFAALHAGTVTLALTGPAEDITGGRSAPALRVSDVAAALRAVVAAGGAVAREAEQGPHEVRAVVQDPWGNLVVVYAPTPVLPPKRTGIDHFSPTVSDAETSAAWYARVLGLERLPGMVRHHAGGSEGYAILLKDPGTGELIGLHQHDGSDPDRFDERRSGLDHLAWGVPSRADLDRWASWLDQLGIGHSGITEVGGSRPYSLIVFRDPDNIQLELIARG
jgi:glyoxylase I family protein